MPTLTFRNLDASPEDPVESWPTEALATALERGSATHWRRIVMAIREQPWGRVARTIESILEYDRPYGVDLLMERAIAKARSDAEAADRAEVARQVREAIAAAGLTQAEAARLLGTSASRLSTYATGKVTPSAAFVVSLRRLPGGGSEASPAPSSAER